MGLQHSSRLGDFDAAVMAKWITRTACSRDSHTPESLFPSLSRSIWALSPVFEIGTGGQLSVPILLDSNSTVADLRIFQNLFFEIPQTSARFLTSLTSSSIFGPRSPSPWNYFLTRKISTRAFVSLNSLLFLNIMFRSRGFVYFGVSLKLGM